MSDSLKKQVDAQDTKDVTAMLQRYRELELQIVNGDAPATERKKLRDEASELMSKIRSLGFEFYPIGAVYKKSEHEQHKELLLHRFQHGNIVAAGSSLDLAINGHGFFAIQDTDGSTLYTRAGAFGEDKDGRITDEHGRVLIGFLTDELNNITEAYGPLVINRSDIAPKVTANVDVKVNLPSNATPPALPFLTGFTPANPPASATYNFVSTVQIYDSLGKEHIMTMYYVKSDVLRTWNVYVGIDDIDVTPTAAIPPAAPGVYPAGQLARPFTIVFDECGHYVVHNPASLPEYFGAPPVLSTVMPTVLATAGTLEALKFGDLTINWVAISPDTTTDVVSTSNPRASAISILNAINAHTALHGVIASTTGTILQFTGGVYTTDALGTWDLTINGVPIVGSPGATPASLAALINATGGSGVPGVIASTYIDALGATQLQLVALDGRNIHVATGGVARGMNFTNFATAGGAALDEVMRGQVSLTIPNNQGITIGGNNPGIAGLTAGTLAGIFQPSSDPIAFLFNPGLGAQPPQLITVNLSASTQWSDKFTISALAQDGYATGSFARVDVAPNGIITGRYDNGKSRQFGQLILASILDLGELVEMPYSAWAASANKTGEVKLGAPGTKGFGLVQSFALEDICYTPYPYDERISLYGDELVETSHSGPVLLPPAVTFSSLGAPTGSSHRECLLAPETAAEVVALGDLPPRVVPFQKP